MANVLIVVYLLIVLALIAVILLQRSEGGGLGMGGGGGGGFAQARSSGNILSRTTAILAALFFATAIGLTIIAEVDRGSRSILENAATTTEQDGSDGAPTNVLDALNSLQGADEPAAPATQDADAPNLPVPAAEQPATTDGTSN